MNGDGNAINYSPSLRHPDPRGGDEVQTTATGWPSISEAALLTDSSPDPDAILTEDGEGILTEDSEPILIE